MLKIVLRHCKTMTTFDFSFKISVTLSLLLRLEKGIEYPIQWSSNAILQQRTHTYMIHVFYLFLYLTKNYYNMQKRHLKVL